MAINFLHEGTTFSFRKLLALQTSFIFLVDCGWSIAHTNVLNGTQYGIIAGVFAFYFSKTILEGLKIGKK